MILAGGRSTRLGGYSKGLLEREGRTVLEWQLGLKPRAAQVLLVCNAPEPYARFGLPTVPDAHGERGAPGGVLTALERVTTPWVWVLACDMPFVTPALAGALLSARDARWDAVLFAPDGKWEPLCALYHRRLGALWSPRMQALRPPGFRRLLEGRPVKTVPEAVRRAADPTGVALQSINTPEQASARGLRGGEGGPL